MFAKECILLFAFYKALTWKISAPQLLGWPHTHFKQLKKKTLKDINFPVQLTYQPRIMQ